MDNFKNYGYLNLADEERSRRTPKHSILRTLLLYVLPFVVINLIIFFIVTSQPDFELIVTDPGDYKSADVMVKIKTIYPKKDFAVLLDSEKLELTQVDKRTYTTMVTHNGTLEVTLTNLNGMNKTVYENISCIDDAPPLITEDDAEPGFVSLYVEDSQAGVNYDSIYGIDADGKRLRPSTIDKGEGLIVFNYDSPSLEIHVSDLIGHESILTCTTHTETAS